MPDSLESKLDQVLACLGQLSARCDKLDKRVADMNDGGKDDPKLSEGGESPADIASAKRLAADAAKYTKYGSTCNPGFADSVSVDPIQALNLEGQALRQKLRQVEQAQKNLVSNMRPLDASEEAEMREFQVRADDVYRAAGEDVRCPAPLAFERPSMFKVRVLNDLARHSPNWGKAASGGELERLDPKGLNVIGNQIMDEAKAAFKRGDHFPKDVLMPHLHVADDGTRMTDWTGPVFIRQFKLPRRIMRIREPKELRAENFMNR